MTLLLYYVGDRTRRTAVAYNVEGVTMTLEEIDSLRPTVTLFTEMTESLRQRQIIGLYR